MEEEKCGHGCVRMRERNFATAESVVVRMVLVGRSSSKNTGVARLTLAWHSGCGGWWCCAAVNKPSTHMLVWTGAEPTAVLLK